MCVLRTAIGPTEMLNEKPALNSAQSKPIAFYYRVRRISVALSYNTCWLVLLLD